VSEEEHHVKMKMKSGILQITIKILISGLFIKLHKTKNINWTSKVFKGFLNLKNSF